MKRMNLFSIIILFLIVGCKKREQVYRDDLIIIDVTKSYAKKKELILQDFMDVEYIPLETNDDFINQGFVQDIGKKYILVTNRNDDGDIFVYSRTGNALTRINHKGQSGEEYTSIYCIVLDESRNEIFINDIYAKKIFVYKLSGIFSRSFEHNGNMPCTQISNYDETNLICYDQYNEEIAFVLISKKDGRITKEIKVPFKEKIFLRQQLIDNVSDIVYTVIPGYYSSIIPNNDNWFLSEFSTDTVFQFLPDYSLRPFIVRTPPIQSMEPKVFLLFRLFTDRYYFMETIKSVYDFNFESGFPRTFFVYDKQEMTFFRYILYNGDYSTKKEIYLNTASPVNHEIASWYPIEAPQLVKSYKKGELKGKLKEISATLDDDSNPVIMLIKHKK